MLAKILLTAALALNCAGIVFAQSLGDVARQERARKGEPSPQSGKVYTNEDIPAPALAGPPTTPAESQPGQPAQPGKGASGDDKKAAADQDKSQADLEKEFVDKFAKLRENLDLQSQKLDVMQRELNLAQQQFYTNPQTALLQETFRTDINKRTQDIEAQKLAVEKAKQAITDLEDELHQKGLPPGWARETGNTASPATAPGTAPATPTTPGATPVPGTPAPNAP